MVIADRISNESRSHSGSSSPSNSSRGEDDDLSQAKKNKKASDVSTERSKARGDEDAISNRNLARREQYLVLGFTYAINFFAILGLSREFVTCTFYDNNDDPDPNKVVITQAEIQVILLMTSMTYFFVGNTLEYIRNVEIKIIVPLIAFFGILKIFVS